MLVKVRVMLPVGVQVKLVPASKSKEPSLSTTSALLAVSVDIFPSFVIPSTVTVPVTSMFPVPVISLEFKSSRHPTVELYLVILL